MLYILNILISSQFHSQHSTIVENSTIKMTIMLHIMKNNMFLIKTFGES
jgi:hypothetical protein